MHVQIENILKEIKLYKNTFLAKASLHFSNEWIEEDINIFLL